MKILYIHNKAMWYRIPFFNKLSEVYDMQFVFTDEKNAHGLNARCTLLKSYGVYPFSMTPGLIPMLIKERFDIVMFPSIAGPLLDQIICFIIVKIRRKPYIWGSDRFFHKKNIFSIQGLRNKLSDLLFGVVARNANAYFVPSEGHKKYPLSLGVSPDKIFVVPNASKVEYVAQNIEDAEKIRKQLNIGNKKVVLFVGRLIKIKGLEYLIGAIAKLRNERKDIVLIIVGDEYFKQCKDYVGNEIKKLCKDLNMQEVVHFIGNVKHNKLAPFYILCNVFVLPSITLERKEAWGLVLNEAMTFGKPIIATEAVGAASALIKNEVNGFIIPEKDINALSEAIIHTIADSEIERKMGLESKKIIEERFTYQHMVNGFQNVIEHAFFKEKRIPIQSN